MTKFINDALTNKFSGLKQAQNLLSTLTQSLKAEGKSLLYKKNLKNAVVPLFNVKIVIVTPIGPFVISIALDIRYSCDIVISLVNTRSIDFGIAFGTSLDLSLMFGYGFPGII